MIIIIIIIILLLLLLLVKYKFKILCIEILITNMFVNGVFYYFDIEIDLKAEEN